jgi:hypothetical protein
MNKLGRIIISAGLSLMLAAGSIPIQPVSLTTEVSAYTPSTGNLARAGLTAKDQELYDKLVLFAQGIISANSEISSRFTYLAPQLDKEQITAADLGLSDLSDNNAISAAISSIYDYDVANVVAAVVADNPYSFLWYGKSFSCGISQGGYANYSTYSTMSQTPSLYIDFAVSQSYKGNNEQTVDVSRRSGVSSVVTNAQAIVEKYAGVSDYEKLAGYVNEICDLVEYDTDASQIQNPTDLDPWNLVSVFDGDSDTNVVCEGYSKAFKYLCDLSSFSGTVNCYLVTGELSGGTGSGPHMWNVVTIDSNNYLVDVTNHDGNADNGCPFLLKGGTPVAAGQYNFYNNGFIFVYDNDTKGLWDSSILTLAAADYITDVPTSMSLSILDGSTLGVNILFDKTDFDYTGYTAELSGAVTVAAKDISALGTATYTVSSGGGTVQKTYYRLTVPVAAKEMRDTFTVTIKSGSTTVKTINKTVYDYAKAVLANAGYSGSHDKIKAMLMYGGAAQTFFNHNTSKLASEGISFSGESVPDNDAFVPASAEFNTYLSNNSAPVSYAYMTLTLVDTTTISLYFTYTDKNKAETYLNEWTFGGNAPVIEEVGDKLAVRYTGIPVSGLANNIAFSNASHTFNVNPVQYMYLAAVKNRTANTTTYPGLAELCDALYAFYRTAV